MMRKLWRKKKMKDNTLQVFYGKLKYCKPDICYQWGKGCSSSDSHLLHCYLTILKFETGGKSLIDELESRGYDITTLEFSIKKKASE